VQVRTQRLRRERKLARRASTAELRGHGIKVSASGVHRVLVRLGLDRLRDLDPPTGERLGVLPTEVGDGTTGSL
jgi:hypothetical protein